MRRTILKARNCRNSPPQFSPAVLRYPHELLQKCIEWCQHEPRRRLLCATLATTGTTGQAKSLEARKLPADGGNMGLFDLKGRVAVVTGGNGGIGLGMARGLAQAGAAVAIAGRNVAKSEEAAAALAKLGVKTAVLEVDVIDEAACHKMVADTVKQLGRLDILVNNAGINIRKPAHEMSLAEWRQVIDVNLTSTFVCSQAAYPVMRDAGGGKIINIGSMLSIFGAAFAPAYGASKGGVVQLTKSLATAWAKDNIQVNAVLPGWIDTELTQKARVEVSGLNSLVLMRTPAKRWGVPDDMSGVAVFLAAPASDFVTGTAIPVDGGYSVQV
jgi:2-deoxy-D-gluconate 3-dehydrogenase